MRPLALGKLKNSYVIASESCAFDIIGADFISDVRPGEVIVINGNGSEEHANPHTSKNILVYL
jgi:amidophosphoribosyltransferase